MRQSLVAGNWKMNGSSQSVRALVDGLKKGIGDVKEAQVAVCPPYVYLPMVSELLAGTPIKWGVQNVSEQDSGAFTGEVSVSMLKDFGCTYAIVGHSERRTLYGETDDLVAKKFVKVQAGGLTPILCVGELLEERKTNKTEAVVRRQLETVLKLVGVSAFSNAVIAYEPVWAIGTGRNATPQQAQEVHAFIRSLIAKQDSSIAPKLIIQYGGSMKGSNAAELLAMPDIDGGLIGGAALKADEFLTICKAIQ
ncbi:MAG: triose-phosphate isomerase [Beggiatoa sp. IS2]|nr:MAG: triose-phosphate isomerase [Beggiatoa sp. IS2]